MANTQYKQLNEGEGEDQPVTLTVNAPAIQETKGRIEPNKPISNNSRALDPKLVDALKNKKKIYGADHMLAMERLFEFWRYQWTLLDIFVGIGLLLQLNWYTSIYDDWYNPPINCYEAGNRNDLNTSYTILYVTFGSFIIYPIIWIYFRFQAKKIFNQRTFNGLTGKIGKTNIKYICAEDTKRILWNWKLSLRICILKIILFVPMLVMAGIVWTDINQFEVDCECEYDYGTICEQEYSNMTYTDWAIIYGLYILNISLIVCLLKKFKKNSKTWVAKINGCCCCFGN